MLSGLGDLLARPEIRLELAPHLWHDDEEIRAAASRLFAQATRAPGKSKPDHGLVALLARATEDPRAWARAVALGALKRLGSSVCEAGDVMTSVWRCLDDGDTEVRIAAENVLVDAENVVALPEMITQLVERIRQATGSDRLRAMWILGKLGKVAASRDALEAIGECLRDGERSVRRQAAFAVVCLGEAAYSPTS